MIEVCFPSVDHQKARQNHKKIDRKRVCGQYVLLKANRVSDVAKVYPNSQQAAHAIKGVEMVSVINRVLHGVGGGNSGSLKNLTAQRTVRIFAIRERASHCHIATLKNLYKKLPVAAVFNHVLVGWYVAFKRACPVG